MPGTPAVSPVLGIPRYADSDTASFSAQVNAITDTVDSKISDFGITFVGATVIYFGATAPTDPDGVQRWIFAQGQSLSRATYPALFALFGTTYGAVDSAHFNLPNLETRFPVGAGAGYPLGGTPGGAASVSLSQANLPAVSFPATVTDTGHAHTISRSAYGQTGVFSPGGSNQVWDVQQESGSVIGSVDPAATGIGVTVSSGGSDTPIPTVPPYLQVNFLIKVL